MVTTILNRILAFYELDTQILLVIDNHASESLIAQLQQKQADFVFNSFWESGIEFAIQFMVIGIVARIFLKPILEVCDAMHEISEGIFTHKLKKRNDDEIGDLVDNYNNMIDELNKIMSNVDYSAIHMGQSAYQIAAVSKEIENSSKTEAERDSEVSHETSALNNISQNIRTMATGATDKAKETETKAIAGISSIQRNIKAMGFANIEIKAASEQVAELSQSAQKIYNIIDTIRDIAEQTNLLALNAAIEAARAGETGRGFAVVADEVRNLASRTTSSAGEVSDIIQNLTTQVNKVTSTMASVVKTVSENQDNATETEQIITQMEKDVSETAIFNQQISEATEEQLNLFQHLQKTLDLFFITLKENGAKIANTANISDSLFTLTENLNSHLSGLIFDKNAHTNHKEPSDERRNHQRIQSTLLIRTEAQGMKFDGITNDVSLSGIRVQLNKALPSHLEQLTINISLPHHDINDYVNQAPLNIQGTIKWHKTEDKKFLYGLQFNNLSQNQASMIQSCIDFFNTRPNITHAHKTL